MAVTLAELARRFHGRVRGNPDQPIERVSALERAGPRDIAFVAGKKYLPQLALTRAGAVILTAADAERYAGNALLVDEPHLCFALVANLLHPAPPPTPGVHPSARVDPSARIAPTACVGPNCVIEAGATLGERVYLGPGCLIGRDSVVGDGTRLIARVAVLHECVLGGNGLLHPGAVIGSDGFGYARDGVRWLKIPQIGRAVLGDDVEVGANTTIDRGALADTVIGDGVKLDNQIQIAHNVRIGEHTAVAGCVGIAGSAVIGRRCTIGGHTGILGHLEIADDVHITAGSLVTGSITQPGTYSSSLKVEPVEQWRRNAARLRHLDELARRLRHIEDTVEQLKKGG